MTSNSHPILDLPVELFHTVLSHLPNRDIKSLRLVSKQFCDSVELRLSRVFLSANPLNIKVFRAVADHNKFRYKITEIVWDDTRVSRGPRPDIIDPRRGIFLPNSDLSDNEIEESFDEEDSDHEHFEDDEDLDSIQRVKNSENFNRQNCPLWFKAGCVESLERIFDRRSGPVLLPQDCPTMRELCSTGPSLSECWEFYRGLVRKQDDVLAGGYDEEAFVYGLEQFPALNKVTVTPAAHNMLFTPFYQTPMIRAFPRGFIYPVPYGWPTSLTEEPEDVITFPWQGVDERHREKYRGFRIVIRALAQQKHNVVELSLDARQRFTGINCTIFDEPCPEYDHFVKVLKKPGFRHLDLPFIFGGRTFESNWESFRNGRLYAALSEAVNLEEFSFYTAGLDYYVECQEPPITTAPVLLERIFPLEKWPKLRHFELSRFIVSQADLILCLSKLPDTLRSVKLSFLVFVDNGNLWRVFLTEMRRQIRERHLWPDRRPKFIIGTEQGGHCQGEAVWFEKDIESFLYEDGECPFKDSRGNRRSWIWNTERCI
ncbi:hypothetical protein N7510_002132 [Penicillium lagena]|uniref:uncharacterized protein n=1 Tax=Penicillium lagena TaxID=94218 RepID=UPI0025408068|nr:uncharacterized protein N7510_002132 [Penicillium lagena]KAJ5625823.1 hypothetical protein N7510_002132 [Penicillium lagena]